MKRKKAKFAFCFILFVILASLTGNLVYPAKSITLPFSDGFESGDFSAWTGIASGNPSVVTTQNYDGKFSMESDDVSESVYKTFTGQATVFVRVYVYFTGLPDAWNDYPILRLSFGRNWDQRIAQIMVRREWTLKLRLISRYPTIQSDTYDYDFQVNTWYCIELKFVRDTSAGEYEVYLNGLDVISRKRVDTSGSDNASLIHVGSDGFTGTIHTTYFDCVKVSNAYIGPETQQFPLASNIGTNNTIAGRPTIFHSKWYDIHGLSGFIFGTNNTGTWQNNTWTPLSGKISWANVTVTLNSKTNVAVGYRWWVNSTTDSGGDSGIKIVNTMSQNPSLVSTTSVSEAISAPVQRKSFYANGRYWVFYSTDNYINKMVYRTSVDGSTWSPEVELRSGNKGYYFSVVFDGTYVHYAHARDVTGLALYYRRGIPNSDGTITWSTDTEQTALAEHFEMRYAFPTIAVDSEGYPFIGYKCENNTLHSRYPYVTKSSLNNGTWLTASGFPYQLSTVSDPDYRLEIVALTNSKVYALYPSGNPSAGYTIKGRLFNGTHWGSEEVVAPSKNENRVSHSMVNNGDDIHLVFTKQATYDIVYVKRTYGKGWESEVTVQSSTTAVTCPVLSIDNEKNILYCFWADSPEQDHIYYKRNLYEMGWDAEPTDWITDDLYRGGTPGAAPNPTGMPTSYLEAYEGRIVLLFETGEEPYNIKHKLLNVTVPDSLDDWTCDFGTHELDTVDKKEGSASIKANGNGVQWNEITERYDPLGTWNWSSKTTFKFWVKPDNTHCRVMIYTSWGNYVQWTPTVIPDVWQELELDLSSPDLQMGTFNLSSVDFFEIRNQQVIGGETMWIDGFYVF